MTVMDRPKTVDAAKGRWRNILPMFGIDSKFLNGKNGPCPACGGKDRFMFDDRDGSGSWICRQGCGAGYGVQLVQAMKGWDFAKAASEVDMVVGNAPVEKSRSKPVLSDEQRREQMRSLWNMGNPVQDGDAVDTYLSGRGLAMPSWPPSFRTIPGLRVAGRTVPVFLARIDGADGKCVQIQKTYLDAKQPGGKADMGDRPSREFLGFGFPDGPVAVRLGPIQEHMGVAEGIETALAAMRLGTMTVWACLNASLMQKWRPPEGCKRVTVWADNDRHYAGQKAGYLVANRIAGNQRIDCEVHEVRVPDEPGSDWLDVLNIRMRQT